MRLHMWITLVSYLALLLLVKNPGADGWVQIGLLFALGGAGIVWKQPWKRKEKISGITCVFAAAVLFYLVYRFFKRWLPTAQVLAIAEMVHMPRQLLVGISAVGLAVCAGYTLTGIAQQIMGIMRIGRKSFANDLCRCMIIAVAMVAMIQIMAGSSILSMGIIRFAWNVAIMMVVILCLWLLFGSMEPAAALGTGVFLVIAAVNMYVIRFRNRLFEPVDIFSAGTAMNVLDNFSLLPIPRKLICAGAVWIGLIGYLAVSAAKSRYRLAGKQRLALAVCCVAGIASIYGYTAGLETNHWYLQGAVKNGYILEFTANLKEIAAEKPDGYSADVIEALLDSYPENEEGLTAQTKRPHIIAIMNEAFSDLSVNGDYSTNIEVMPFLSSMEQDVIRGYALASVYGGNTANSEFEFLTGNSMAWLSPNAVPYQQYLRSSAYSVVSELTGKYGYRAIAMHPFMADGWNRPTVYANMGFEACFFQEDFPQQHLLRNYISDQEMFEMVVEQFEEHRSEPLFLFGVSMQNHGGYDYRGDRFEQSVELVGMEQEHPDAEQYLSLIYETDKAVEYLISYFERVEEDVVIVFFGDHQPKLEESFYTQIGEPNKDALDERQKRYMVPFFVWANYDIDERYVECASLNYLSTYMYEAAGLPLPPYNQFLSDLEEKIPAINAYGFYSMESKCYLPFEQASGEEEAWLLLYEQLQYNNLFDKKDRSGVFFPVPE